MTHARRIDAGFELSDYLGLPVRAVGRQRGVRQGPFETLVGDIDPQNHFLADFSSPLSGTLAGTFERTRRNLATLALDARAAR